MRSQHTPMTWEEYERMPWRFGWKHEYWDGCAHLTPRHNHVHVRPNVAPRQQIRVPPDVLRLRAVSDANTEELIHAFIETFEDGVEFCDWKTKEIHEHARRNITDFFANRRGAPHNISRVAVLMPEDGGEMANSTRRPADAAIVVAAALFTRKTNAAAVVLDLLMVRPGYRRQSLATLLVAAGLNDLHMQGEAILRSAYHVANEESAAWHQAFGFTEEPDLHLALLRRSFYYHETTRCEGSEAAEVASEHARLKTTYEFWHARVDELEEICERDGYEAVTPSLRLD